MKSGFVSLIGRPNTGKSTLLNTILKEKIAITTPKSGTTRNLIEGIYNEQDIQIVFVDTPGIHKPQDRMGQILNNQAYYSINDVDILLFVIDGSANIGKGDMFVIEKLKMLNKPVFLVINKIDKLNNEEILLKINEYKDLYDFVEIVPVSAKKNDNVDRLINVLKNYLPDEVKYFTEDETTTASLEFRLSEIVREKVFLHTSEEVPHKISCKLSDYIDEENITNIYIDIIVDRESLRKIIIGKNGDKIKQIGIESRIDMEKLLGKKIYLELYVKTIKNWREKEKIIKELGYLEF